MFSQHEKLKETICFDEESFLKNNETYPKNTRGKKRKQMVEDQFVIDLTENDPQDLEDDIPLNDAGAANPDDPRKQEQPPKEGGSVPDDPPQEEQQPKEGGTGDGKDKPVPQGENDPKNSPKGDDVPVVPENAQPVQEKDSPDIPNPEEETDDPVDFLPNDPDHPPEEVSKGRRKSDRLKNKMSGTSGTS